MSFGIYFGKYRTAFIVLPPIGIHFPMGAGVSLYFCFFNTDKGYTMTTTTHELYKLKTIIFRSVSSQIKEELHSVNAELEEKEALLLSLLSKTDEILSEVMLDNMSDLIACKQDLSSLANIEKQLLPYVSTRPDRTVTFDVGHEIKNLANVITGLHNQAKKHFWKDIDFIQSLDLEDELLEDTLYSVKILRSQQALLLQGSEKWAEYCMCYIGYSKYRFLFNTKKHLIALGIMTFATTIATLYSLLA